MDPENIQKEELLTANDRLASLKKVTPLSKYLAMAFFIVLPFLGAYIGYLYAPGKVVEVEKFVEENKKEIEQFEFQNYQAGIAFELPHGWIEVDDLSLVDIPGVTNPIFSLQNEDSSCMVVYDVARNGTFVSEYKRFYSEDDGSRFNNSPYRIVTHSDDYSFITSELAIEEETFNLVNEIDQESQKLNTEDRTAFIDENVESTKELLGNDFVWFTTGFGDENQPLVGETFLVKPTKNIHTEEERDSYFDCVKEYETMIESARPLYKKVVLHPKSAGTLYINSVSVLGEEIDQVLFKDELSEETHLLEEFDGSGTPSPIVYGGSVYLIKEGHINVYLPLMGIIEPLLAENLDGARVNSMYIVRDQLYYLLGDYCRSYGDECNLSLRKIDLPSKEETILVASGITERHIHGYREADNTMLLTYTDGDGSHRWGHGSVFSLDQNSVTKSLKYAADLGPVDAYDEAYEEFQLELEKYSVLPSSHAVRVERGVLSASETSGVSGWKFNFAPFAIYGQ